MTIGDRGTQAVFEIIFVEVDIDPGKPIQNAFTESFNGWLQDDCLNEHWFLGLRDARMIVEAWRQDYNQRRPHSALGYATPVEVAERMATVAEPLTLTGLS